MRLNCFHAMPMLLQANLKQEVRGHGHNRHDRCHINTIVDDFVADIVVRGRLYEIQFSLRREVRGGAENNARRPQSTLFLNQHHK